MKRRLRWLVLAASWSLHGVASAESTTDLESLLNEQVVTTASTVAERSSAAPATTTTITADDLQQFGIRNLAEAIDYLSLGVVTGANLNGPDVGARGVLFVRDDGKHFLLLINGHAVNDPLYGAARFDQGAGVPIGMIDRIEVVVGPGSVLYGSNAMMGVVNVITKDASTYKGGHVTAELQPGQWAHASGGAGVPFRLFGERAELTLGVDYQQRFGPSLTFAPQDFARLQSELRYQFDPNDPRLNVWGGKVNDAVFAQTPAGLLRLRVGELEVNVMASAHRRGVPYATEFDPVTFDDDRNVQLDRSLRFDVKHRAMLSSLVQLSSRVYADGIDRQRRSIVPSQVCLMPVRFCQYYDAGKARWIGLEERVTFDWLHDQSLVTLLGLDLRNSWGSAKQDILDADAYTYLGPTVGRFDKTAYLIAPHVQQTYSPTRWLDLNAGARFDRDSRFSPVLSPRGAVAVKPWDTGTLKAIYSQAFRAPTWSETVLANQLVAPSDGVRPEIVRSVEASFEQRAGTQRVLFGAFRSWWTRLIESSALSSEELERLQLAGRLPIFVSGSLIQYQNVATVDNYGWLAGWDGTAASGRLRYAANVTGAITRVSNELDDELAAAPQLFGNARVAYASGGWVPTPGLAATVMSRRDSDRLRATGDELPSAPPAFSFRLTLTGKIPPVPGLSYSATGAYLTSSVTPYAAGPQASQTSLLGREARAPIPELVPMERVTVFFGLRYDFMSGDADPGGTP